MQVFKKHQPANIKDLTGLKSVVTAITIHPSIPSSIHYPSIHNSLFIFFSANLCYKAQIGLDTCVLQRGHLCDLSRLKVRLISASVTEEQASFKKDTPKSHGRLEFTGKLPGGGTGALHLRWKGVT